MVLGIILITIGIIGAIATVILGVIFMKRNRLLFKGEYVELKTDKKEEEVYSTGELSSEEGLDTELLIMPDTQTVYQDGSDTELL